MRTNVALLVQTGSDEMCHISSLTVLLKVADVLVIWGAYRACRFWPKILMWFVRYPYLGPFTVQYKSETYAIMTCTSYA